MSAIPPMAMGDPAAAAIDAAPVGPAARVRGTRSRGEDDAAAAFAGAFLFAQLRQDAADPAAADRVAAGGGLDASTPDADGPAADAGDSQAATGGAAAPGAGGGAGGGPQAAAAVAAPTDDEAAHGGTAPSPEAPRTTPAAQAADAVAHATTRADSPLAAPTAADAAAPGGAGTTDAASHQGAASASIAPELARRMERVIRRMNAELGLGGVEGGDAAVDAAPHGRSADAGGGRSPSGPSPAPSRAESGAPITPAARVEAYGATAADTAAQTGGPAPMPPSATASTVMRSAAPAGPAAGTTAAAVGSAAGSAHPAGAGAREGRTARAAWIAESAASPTAARAAPAVNAARVAPAAHAAHAAHAVPAVPAVPTAPAATAAAAGDGGAHAPGEGVSRRAGARQRRGGAEGASGRADGEARTPAATAEAASDRAAAWTASEAAGRSMSAARSVPGGVERTAAPAAASAAERVAHVQELRDAAASRPLSRILLRLEDADGGSGRIRVDLRGASVRADIAVADAGEAARLERGSGQLRQALLREGLALDTLRAHAAGGAVERADAPRPLLVHGLAEGGTAGAAQSHEAGGSRRDDGRDAGHPHQSPRRDPEGGRQRSSREHNGREHT